MLNAALSATGKLPRKPTIRLSGSPQIVQTGFRHQRVVAVDGERIAEVAGRGDLRERPVVHEHELEIRLDRRADLIVRKCTGDVALVGPLEEVQRSEVVEVLSAGRDRSRRKRRDRRAAAREKDGRTRIRRRRTAATRNAAARVLQNAGGIVAIALKDRLDVAIAEIGNGMAAAVVEAGADRDRAVDRATVGRATGRKRELGLARDGLASAMMSLMWRPAETLGSSWLCCQVLKLPSNRTPSKLVSMMKLTTPATASAPYTDDAPPVRTSARRISAAGMTLRSADWFVLFGSPGMRRRPLTRTSERFAPKVAKIDFGRTRRAVRNARRLRGADGRQLVENVLDPGRTGQLHVLVGNDRDRSGQFEVRLRNARTGNDDVLRYVSTASPSAETDGVGCASTGPVGCDAVGSAV